MRSFPRARRLRLMATMPTLTALACFGLVTATVVTSGPLAYAGDGPGHRHLEDRQTQIHAQVQQAAQDADDASAEVSQAAQAVTQASAALDQAYAALTTAKQQVTVVGGQLGAAQTLAGRAQSALDQAQTVSTQAETASTASQTALEQAQAAVVTGRQQLEAQRTLVQQTVVDLYQSGSPQLLTLTGYLDSDSPSDLTRRMEYSQTLVEDQTTAFDGLHDAEVALVGQQRQADTAATQADASADHARQAEQVVATAQADAASKLAATQALSDQAAAAAEQAQQARVSVAATLEDRQRAEQDAKAARKADLATLAQVKQQEAHVKQLILAAAANDASQGFVGASSGYLLSPMAGAELTSPFGYRIHPIYGYWGLHDGDDFAAPCGTPMRASADGTVIASYWSDVYGNRLYIDVGKVNGHAITVNYNHAVSYTVGVGDQVTRGQTVGYEGTTGWSTGCHTHFTVLADGTPVDPMTYINGNG